MEGSLKAYDPLKSGLMIGVVGPPGWGKSTFASTVPQPFHVVAAPARELSVYHGLDASYEVVEESIDNWDPQNGKFNAKAFWDSLTALRKAKDLDVKAVVVDAASRQLFFALNAALAPFKTDDPAKLGQDSRSVWASVKARSVAYCDALEAVRSSGKHLVAVFHQDVREVEGKGTPTLVPNKDGTKQVHWSFGKTAEVLGSFRDTIAGRFDVWGFMEREIAPDEKSATYSLRVAPSRMVEAKNSIPGLKGVVKVEATFDALAKAIK